MFTRLFLISTLVVLSTAPVFGETIYVSSGNKILKIVDGVTTPLHIRSGRQLPSARRDGLWPLWQTCTSLNPVGPSIASIRRSRK